METTTTTTVDKEFGSAMGALFHQIITDMKVGAPLWEDFLSKASKLHTALKSTLSVIAAYLDAFQKIADSATNAKGATKDIGTVLTRICLRHKAVEARLKTFTSALMECLVLPLHDKLEEWKKMVVNLDKEHSKEYKKVRADIKKRTAEAQRWQKKAKKIRSGMGGSHGTGMNSMGPANDRQLNAANQELLRAADAAQTDLNSRLALLQDTEKQALKSALVEERSRYCLFVACLKPVMSEEMAMMAELSHLEEIIGQLDKHTADPFSLPSSTEQMISELKGTTDHNHWALQTPPSSPSSLGSRKSSMCSLGSIHSSSSGSVASHSQNQLMNSPSHVIQQQQQQHIRHRSLSQVAGVNAGVRLSSVSSQDSGFTSQDTLVLRPNSSPPSNQLTQEVVASSSTSSGECSSSNSNSSTPCTPYPPGMGSTWPNLQETIQFDRAPSNNMVINERPHTISTAYEKGHQRPALSVYTFQPLEQQHSSAQSSSIDKFDRTNNSTPTHESPEYETLRRCRELKASGNGSSQESLGSSTNRPPLPQRCSSLERPVVPSGKTKEKINKKNSLILQQQDNNQQPASVLPDFHQAAPDMIVPQPVYMNASELRCQQASSSNGEDPASHAIYSSLAQCTVYEDGQACSCHGPSRDMWRHPTSCISSRPVLRRPASFSAGYADPGSMTSDWNPRGSVRMSTIKRTSIPSFATLHEVSNVDEAHHDDIIPPPDMTSSSVDDIDLAALPPPPDFLLETNDDDTQHVLPVNKEVTIPARSLSVADAVKTLNEIRHQPASPGVVRRAQSMRATTTTDSSLPPVGLGRGGNHPATSILAKAVGATPKAKQFDIQHSFTLTKNPSTKAPPPSANHNTKTLPKQMPSHPLNSEYHDPGGKVVSGLLSKSSFVHQLNAKLAQQQHVHQADPTHPAQRNARHEPAGDHHESLMDQIRRGTSLRRARSTSDRSSPHFKH